MPDHPIPKIKNVWGWYPQTKTSGALRPAETTPRHFVWGRGSGITFSSQLAAKAMGCTVPRHFRLGAPSCPTPDKIVWEWYPQITAFQAKNYLGVLPPERNSPSLDKALLGALHPSTSGGFLNAFCLGVGSFPLPGGSA